MRQRPEGNEVSVRRSLGAAVTGSGRCESEDWTVWWEFHFYRTDAGIEKGAQPRQNLTAGGGRCWDLNLGLQKSVRGAEKM